MKFTRKQNIHTQLYPKRALIIYGPRRVGKTTILQSYLETVTSPAVFSATGDDRTVQEVFASQELQKIKDFSHRYEVIAFDEAQQIPNIGIGAKMLIDASPEKTLILTGSSSLYLATEVGEPLTGRHFTMTLLPLSVAELEKLRFRGSKTSSRDIDTIVYGK